MKYCVQCGAQLEEDQAFCTQCGAPTEDVSHTTVIEADGEEANHAPDDPFNPSVTPAQMGASSTGGTQAIGSGVPPTAPLPNSATGRSLVDAASMGGVTVPSGSAPSDATKKKPNKTIAIVIAVVVVFVLAIIVAVMATKSCQSNSPQDAAEREAELTAADNVQYSTYYVVNCKESISLRESPSVDSAAIMQIPFGAAVSVIEVAENGFYKVVYDGRTGYALASYLSTTRQSTPVQSNDTPSTDVTYETMYVVNCNEWITLRTSPSTSASEITKIPLGASVSYIESAPDGFYKIAYMGKTGYALASYLSRSPSSSASPSSTIYYRVVNCNEWISLRKSPSTSADRYCTIPLGATVTYYSNAGGGFLKVGYNGYVGYALASYLTPA